jgi:hypothetical protein
MSENARFTRVVATADGRSVFEEDTLPLEEQPVAAPSRRKHRAVQAGTSNGTPSALGLRCIVNPSAERRLQPLRR